MQNLMVVRQSNLELLSSDRFRSRHPSIVTKFFVTSLSRRLLFSHAKNRHSNLLYVDQHHARFYQNPLRESGVIKGHLWSKKKLSSNERA